MLVSVPEASMRVEALIPRLYRSAFTRGVCSVPRSIPTPISIFLCGSICAPRTESVLGMGPLRCCRAGRPRQAPVGNEKAGGVAKPPGRAQRPLSGILQIRRSVRENPPRSQALHRQDQVEGGEGVGGREGHPQEVPVKPEVTPAELDTSQREQAACLEVGWEPGTRAPLS
jgi:hypothetical protein